MRTLFLSALVFFAGFTAQAQLLQWQPLFPVDTSTVSITVDCSEGNRGLYNYASTSDVYVHIGLVTSLSTPSSIWQHVLYQWGTTPAAAHAPTWGTTGI